MAALLQALQGNLVAPDSVVGPTISPAGKTDLKLYFEQIGL